MKRVEGKVALVTGGGTGIGKGIVEVLAKEGAKVAIAGVDVLETPHSQTGNRNIGGYTAAKTVAEKLREKGHEAIAIEADVIKQAQVENMIAKTVEAFGRIDIVVHCAGVVTVHPVAELTEDEWDGVMDVNAKGTFLVNQAAVEQMRKQGGGKIINFSSLAGKHGFAGLAHYCASKFAVIGFTKSLAKELLNENITVNVVCPGIVATQMWTLLRKEFAERGETEEDSYMRNVRERIPQGVPQTAKDMAEAVLFLAVSDHVTAQAISVDGGASE